LIVIFILLFFLNHPLLHLLKKYALILAFLVSLLATVLSLFYSEIIGYTPCVLCWIERIFIYPQTILLAVAYVKKDTRIADYSIALSVLGGGVALYHYYGQMFNESALPCSITASCAQRFFLEFGYISIPMMALTSFVLLIILMSIVKYKTKN